MITVRLERNSIVPKKTLLRSTKLNPSTAFLNPQKQKMNAANSTKEK